MTPAKEVLMVVEKSQEEVEQIVALVQSSNLPEGTKPFVIGCINLASWIPRALVEHKITVSNLKRIIFGKGDKATKQKTNLQRKNRITPLQNSTHPTHQMMRAMSPKTPKGMEDYHIPPTSMQQNTILLWSS